MSHPKGIAFESAEVTLQRLRECPRTTNDQELIAFDKLVRQLGEPRVSVTPDPWEGAIAGGARRVETKASAHVRVAGDPDRRWYYEELLR